MLELEKICREIEKAAKETGEWIISESKNFDINLKESKGINNFVSYVDKGSERMLVQRLTAILPEAGFLTEEETIEKKGDRYCWVIDPLDGTTNFLHGLHPFAISIGLTDNEEVVAGVVEVVGGNETFTAWKGGGSWLNGTQIHVSGASKLADSLVATGFPYSDFGRLDTYMDCLTWFCQNSHGIRRLGSAATDLAYVACGRFEVFYEYGLHPWDIAAGLILIKEAGGRVGDFSGKDKNLDGTEIIGSNSAVFDEVQKIVSNFMKK
jgi:myo-inositol-1(or 4)-monophosphatase